MERTLHHVDARGTVCPLPVLLTVREMLRMDIGEYLEVVGDDPAMREDLTAWCETSGNRLLEMTEEGSEVRCVIEKVRELF